MAPLHSAAAAWAAVQMGAREGGSAVTRAAALLAGVLDAMAQRQAWQQLPAGATANLLWATNTAAACGAAPGVALQAQLLRAAAS